MKENGLSVREGLVQEYGLLQRLKDVVAYFRANAFVAMVPFLLNGITRTVLLNSATFTIGFETWNQFLSSEEDKLNGKHRPRFDRRTTLAAWALCVAISDWPVRVWLLLCPLVYLSGNSTPLKEAFMFYGIFVHHYHLGIPFDFVRILRHTLTLCIQDVRDMEGDRRIGRTTVPMLVNFQLFYSIVVLAFFMLDASMPMHSLFPFALITILSKSHPLLAYMVWQINYVLELFFWCHPMKY